jgi:hypothetical protein
VNVVALVLMVVSFIPIYFAQRLATDSTAAVTRPTRR